MYLLNVAVVDNLPTDMILGSDMPVHARSPFLSPMEF